MEVIRIKEDKNVKWRYGLKNKLIVFTYHLKLFFTLNHTIKLFYQIDLIYLITSIKLLSHFNLLSWLTKHPLSFIKAHAIQCNIDIKGFFLV